MTVLTELPDDVLFVLFSYFDTVTLRILCRVCHRFWQLASEDCLWIAKSRTSLVTNQVSEFIKNRSCCLISAKEKCRVTLNWKREKYRETHWYLQHRTKYMPWLQMNSKELWLSQGTQIIAHRHQHSGGIGVCPLRMHEMDDEDVCKFVVSQDLVAGSGSEGGLYAWSKQTGKRSFAVHLAHEGTVNGFELLSRDVVLSGAKDRYVKIWTISDFRLRHRLKLFVGDRVWSLAANASGEKFVCGTRGCYAHPLILFSTETGRQISCLGENYQFGAGVLHCLYDSHATLLSGGYDTYIRLWDTRVPNSSSLQWENPYDMAVYCLATDQNMTIISGSSAHGLVWLWDKRSTKPIQMYYIGNSQSPVYSIAFDPYHMYVALDDSICMLNFKGK